LEQRADVLRADKLYLDALDYYRAAVRKDERNPMLLNKVGITELQMQRYKDAEKDFRRSIKFNKKYSEAYNNLGVIYYLHKKYGKAIKHYRKAIALNGFSASFHSNLATAYFARKDFPRAVAEYQRALQLDPNILERTSSAGVEAQLSSPEDRAHYDYILAKMYAAMGAEERSLLYLRKAMEEGYKGIENVYKDAEFSGLRKDPRFNALMGARPPAIPE
jgi:tetratricopeptide (TPR) repeat protein